MSHGTSVLSVSLDRALESFSFGDRRCVDLISGFKYISLDLISKCIIAHIFKFELSHISFGGNPCLVKMTFHGLAHAMSVNDLFLSILVLVGDSFFLVNEAYLNRLITVVLHRLDLRHHAGAGLKYGYGNQASVLFEDLSHSDFGCQNSFFHFFTSIFSTAGLDRAILVLGCKSLTVLICFSS